jgi:hypothetical protein
MFDKQHNLMMNVQLNNDINQVKIVNDEIVEKPEKKIFCIKKSIFQSKNSK